VDKARLIYELRRFVRVRAIPASTDGLQGCTAAYLLRRFMTLNLCAAPRLLAGLGGLS